jgi:hypothetical protein
MLYCAGVSMEVQLCCTVKAWMCLCAFMCQHAAQVCLQHGTPSAAACHTCALVVHPLSSGFCPLTGRCPLSLPSCVCPPGLLGWLAAQVRPGLLSGTLLLALGAALVGGGTAGAALLAGGAYLAASTASEAAAAQQEAAQSPPGASQDTGSAASSSSRGPVAGTAAWLQHKLGKGSDVEGSSGDSSTPATPQQQLNQLAGGALGKGAWAGTPAGAPGVGDTQQEEEAEQDEGGGSSDLISSIITVGGQRGLRGVRLPAHCSCVYKVGGRSRLHQAEGCLTE